MLKRTQKNISVRTVSLVPTILCCLWNVNPNFRKYTFLLILGSERAHVLPPIFCVYKLFGSGKGRIGRLHAMHGAYGS